MAVKSFKDLDKLTIEEIIQLPYFRALQKVPPRAEELETTWMWKITFRCNKKLSEDQYVLLDEESTTQHIIRYRLIDYESKLFEKKSKI